MLVVLHGDWVERIPVAARFAVTIMVSSGTFSWNSLRSRTLDLKSVSLVTFSTFPVVVGTLNLALGVGAGALLNALCFAAKIAKLLYVTWHLIADGTERICHWHGQLFFNSITVFSAAFVLRETLPKATRAVTHSHLWDTTSINALDKVVIKYRQRGSLVKLIGLNAPAKPSSSVVPTTTNRHRRGDRF